MQQLQPYRAGGALDQPTWDYVQYPSPAPDCICDRRVPWCAVCQVAIAALLRHEHPLTMSVAMLKRRIPGLSGREAALLLEATKRLPVDMEAFTREMLEAQSPQEVPAREPLEPETDPPLVLMYSEARMLEVVRSKPGSTSKELGAALGRTTSYIAHTLRLLAKGGHARRENWRWYPTHDRPLGTVSPREKVRWVRPSSGRGSSIRDK